MTNSSSIAVLKDRRILLGICGSIAAYKTADLASKLTQAGAKVDVILTRAAERFISPLTFQSVTGRKAYTDSDLWGSDAHILHVGIAQEAEIFAIAPVTANTIAKLAGGHADSLLLVTALAIHCPLLIGPAMDVGMYEHSATQSNLAALEERGVIIVGPTTGRMASGLIGKGRMVEPPELLGHIRRVLGRGGALAGRKVVVTAGGTHEPIDPVRVIANRSSGKQGFALAQAALDRGADVTLISGPVHLETPIGAERVDVNTAAEMGESVLAAIEGADALVMAAAVADFRPSETPVEKIKRRKGTPKISLEPTDDILALVGARREEIGRPRVVVGFAAETQDLVANARAKLEEKVLALIIANDVTAPDAGFGVDTNRVVILDSEGGVQELPLMSKAEVSEVVMTRVTELLMGGIGNQA